MKRIMLIVTLLFCVILMAPAAEAKKISSVGAAKN